MWVGSQPLELVTEPTAETIASPRGQHTEPLDVATLLGIL